MSNEATPKPAVRPYSPSSDRPSYGPRPGGAGPGRPGGRPPMGGPGGRNRTFTRKRMCRLCQDKTGHIDWKAVNLLRSFITDRGKMLSSRATGTCAGCQRQLARAIKRARDMALLPTSPL